MDRGLEGHPSIETLLRVRHGQSSGREAAAVAGHLSTCRRCSARSRAMFENDALRSVAAAIEGAEPDAEAGKRRWFPWTLAAAAAVLVLAIGGARLFLRPPPSSGMPEYPNAEWTALVRYAVRNRALPPAVDGRDLKQAPDPLRGVAPRERATALAPAGVVIDETRPMFRWPAATGATYTVLLQAVGASIVSSSPELTGSEWRPPFDLQRGVTYEWQVEVRRGSNLTTLPAPSAPPALFRVLDARLHRDLDEAKRRDPNDALLLAVLYARAGMDDRAAAELVRLRSHDAKLADDLRRSLSGGR